VSTSVQRTPPPPPTAPTRPEGHRTLAWLALAGAAGLVAGLLVLTIGSATSEAPPPLAHRSAQAQPVAGPQNGGWCDLELPEGELRRVPLPPGLSALLALKEELDRAPVDARLDIDRRAIRSEQWGRQLDVDASLAAIERALAAGGARAPLIFSPVPPQRRASELHGVTSDVVLGRFETRIERSGTGAREHALGLVARALDGRVILPGEPFSFNAAVGPRDDSHGYPIAVASELDERVDGVGSFASQSASTLYAAAVFAGLEVLERHPLPGPRPVIELGLEAAVAHPALDLRLRNPYDFPIVLRQVAEAGHVRTELRGLRRPHAVTLVRRVESATAFELVERADGSLPLGERVLAQRGIPGLELRWHHVRRDGSHAVRRTSTERYPPTSEIVRVGTGSAPLATGRPQREPTPEYLPGELLVMAQGDGNDGSLAVQRFPGRFGTPGWTKNVGAPAWKSPPQTAGRAF
jgi:vancomycin resistance protein YoaR